MSWEYLIFYLSCAQLRAYPWSNLHFAFWDFYHEASFRNVTRVDRATFDALLTLLKSKGKFINAKYLSRRENLLMFILVLVGNSTKGMCERWNVLNEFMKLPQYFTLSASYFLPDNSRWHYAWSNIELVQVRAIFQWLYRRFRWYTYPSFHNGGWTETFSKQKNSLDTECPRCC